MRCVLGGTLFGQMAVKRGISEETLMTPNSEALKILHADLEELGVDLSLLAEKSLSALTYLLIKSDNADLIISQLSSLLWSVLGDPESGAPPEIYHQAGSAMYLSLISILSPQVPEPFLKSPE
jgi:hypothetical protein